MASALLASRNGPCWGDGTVYMRKNPNPKLCPNPNPNFSLIPNGHGADHRNPFHPTESDEPAAAAVSDDSSCFNRNPADLGRRREPRGRVTFNISAYSKKELRELRRRLVSELEQVRSVTSRIESREAQPPLRSAAAAAYSTSSAQGGCREVPATAKKRSATDGQAADAEMKKAHGAMMKKCTQMLGKLMKHKGGVWFNTPVDVVRMGLHDYHQIIKNPMDLGTVKSRLAKGLYAAPTDFASDVRTTFNNALAYNPQGHVVHSLAALLLRQFDDSFGPAYDRYEKQRSAILRNCSRAEPAPQAQPQPRTDIEQQRPAMLMPKQRKAKGVEKREMSMEEKQRLGDAIQNLPEDKMMEVLQIVSERNVTERNGDEVEIDFELMDNETLWELDGFVAGWNASVGRVRKLDACDRFHTDDKSPCEAVAGKRMRKGEAAAEEEVDIGDEMPANHYPPVEIGKAATASSSGSDSSSSSGSESESSSGRSDTEDEARSPAVESRRSPTS